MYPPKYGVRSGRPNCPQPARSIDPPCLSIAAGRAIQGGCSSSISPRAGLSTLFQGFCVKLSRRLTAFVASLFFVVAVFPKVAPSVPFIAKLSLR